MTCVSSSFSHVYNVLSYMASFKRFRGASPASHHAPKGTGPTTSGEILEVGRNKNKNKKHPRLKMLKFNGGKWWLLFLLVFRFVQLIKITCDCPRFSSHATLLEDHHLMAICFEHLSKGKSRFTSWILGLHRTKHVVSRSVNHLSSRSPYHTRVL